MKAAEIGDDRRHGRADDGRFHRRHELSEHAGKKDIAAPFRRGRAFLLARCPDFLGHARTLATAPRSDQCARGGSAMRPTAWSRRVRPRER